MVYECKQKYILSYSFCIKIICARNIILSCRVKNIWIFALWVQRDFIQSVMLFRNRSRGTCTNSRSGETDCCKSEVSLKGYNIDRETYDILKRYTEESKHTTLIKYTINKNSVSVESPQPHRCRLKSGIDEYVTTE